MEQAQTINEMNEDTLPNDPALPEHSAGVRIGQELMKATMPFASEQASKSWWYVGSTFTLMIAALIGAGMVPWWPVRVMLSILGALVMVRAFITYQDYMHRSMLRDSRVAWLLFHLYAGFALTPPHVPGTRATIIITGMLVKLAPPVLAPFR